jgi:predicted ATPase/class 3 adenylate cyclase
MPDNVSAWLDNLGLIQYATSFANNDIDSKLLSELTNDDLKDLGVRSLGHRKTILDAISRFNRPDPQPVHPDPQKAEAERRQLTVMFCDLVGSTELSQQLDPEILRVINREYQDSCKVAIERFGGYVARYMGDGVLAYFGYPKAHEDDSERAIRAGLQLVESISLLTFNAISAPVPTLSVRVGIATGPVVVGDLIGEGASQESAVVGETPNLAARLESIATTNSVVVSPTTRELAGGLFEYQDLGNQQLKGISKDVNAWQVIDARQSESRFHAVRSTRISPLIGREEEFEIIQRRWQRSCDSRGEVVLLCGEAGIGKSRLTQAAIEITVNDSGKVIRFQSSPHYSNSALFPVIGNLQQYFGLGNEMTGTAKLERVEAQIQNDGLDIDNAVSLYASLLSIPADGRYPDSNATPQQLKDQTLTMLNAHILALAARQPVLIVFEDIHWADPTSIELMDLIIASSSDRRVMMVLTYRPEFQPTWLGETQVSALVLNKLSVDNCTPLIEGIAGGKSLPEEVIQQITQKTDGVPLFVEELTKTILDSGCLRETETGFVLDGDITQAVIPNTLHDSLMARLDRQESAKGLAQTGAVIGREFSHKLIHAVYDKGSESCDQALDKLLKAGLIFKRGTPPEANYIFKHALIQDAAYASLLKSTGKKIHHRIANVLLEQFVLTAEIQPELIAHHFTEAEQYEKALSYWQIAAQRAMERSSNSGAMVYLKKAISFLQHSSDDKAQQELEFKLQIMLMTASIAAKGYGAPATVKVMDRVNELAEHFPDSPLVFSALYSQWVLCVIRAQISQARVFAEKFFKLSNLQTELPAKIMGNRLLGISMLYQGELEKSLPYVDKAISLYEPEKHALLAFQYGQNPLCATLAHKAWLNQLLGNVELSRQFGEQTVEYALEINHANTIAYAYVYGMILPGICRRDVPLVKQAAQSLLETATEHNLPMWIGSAHSIRGWAMFHEGKAETAAAETKKGLDLYFGGGARLDRQFALVILAEYETGIGNLDQGFKYIDEAISQSEDGGEACYLPELYRAKGSLYSSMENKLEQTEAYFQKSLELARQQGARWWELRTSISIAKLRLQQAMPERGYELLQPVYTSFINELDVPDLIEAGQLLQQLNNAQV